MDLTETIAPKSDQLNADDLMSGPRTVTITDVSSGSLEQPVNVHLAEFPDRPFRPSKSMRRVMVSAWGKDSSAYVGKRMTLYRDATIKFGGQAVGGIRVSHMSGLDKRMTLALTETRGKRAAYNVEPLPDAPTPPAGITKDGLDAILAGLHSLGITDKPAMLAAVRDVVGRDLGSARDLTAAEGADVLAWITATREDIADAQVHEAQEPSHEPSEPDQPALDETGGADPATDSAWGPVAEVAP